MATLYQPFSPTSQKPEDEEDKNQPAATTQTVASGEGATVSSAPVTASGATASPTSTGRFANLQRFMKANQDYRQQQGGLTGQVTGNISKAGQDTKKDINKSSDTFQQQANTAIGGVRNAGSFAQGVLNPTNPGYTVKAASANPVAGKVASEAPTAPAQPNGVVAGNANGPSIEDVANNDQLLQQFVQARDAQYTGPRGLADQGRLSTQVKNVASMAGQTGSEAGRFNLLRQMFNRPTYTAGQQKLDQLLLQGDPNQLRQLRSTQKLAGQVGESLKQAQQQAGATADTLSNEAQAISKQVRSSLDQNEQQRLTELDDKVKKAAQERTQLVDRIKQGLSSGQLSGEDMDRLGIQSIDELYGVDLTDPRFFQSSNLEATRQNVANQADYARMAALAKLAGKQNESFTDSTQAGKFFQDQVGFDKNALQQEIAARKAGYENQLATYKKMMEENLTELQNIQRDEADSGWLGNLVGGIAGGLAGWTPAGIAAAAIGEAEMPEEVKGGLNDYLARGDWYNQILNQGGEIEEDEKRIADAVRRYREINAARSALQQQYGIGRSLKRV